ncbi:MAG: ABC transporter transmembrane domain-containing protein [Microcoleaceae cyanobacterium]
MQELVQNYRSDRPLRTLFHLYRNDFHRIGLSILFYIIKHSPEWIRPLVMANIIDIITAPENHSLPELWTNGAILAISIAQNIPTNYLHVRWLSTATHQMEFNLRSTITRQLQYLSIGFHHRQNSGALQNKLLRDVEAVSSLTGYVFQFFPSAVLTIIVAIIATAIRAPEFLLFFIGTVPVSAILIRKLKGPIRTRNKHYREQTELTSAYLIEMLKLVPVTRAHGAEETEIARTEAKLRTLQEAGVRLAAINALANSFAWMCFRSFNLICLLISATLAFTGQWNISPGDVVLLTGYFDSLTGSVVQILTILPQLGKGFEALRSIGEIMESPDLEQNEGKPIVIRVQGEFVFESVSFCYHDV